MKVRKRFTTEDTEGTEEELKVESLETSRQAFEWRTASEGRPYNGRNSDNSNEELESPRYKGGTWGTRHPV